jgi:dolichyl-phosphate beta-glucosyltransferase
VSYAKKRNEVPRKPGVDGEFELSLVVPLSTHEGLGGLLTAVRSFLRDYARASEVVLVDDGCDESIEKIASRWRSQFRGLVVAKHDSRHGRGAAARTGTLAARGDYVVVCDPELDIPLVNTTLLIESLSEGADVAIVSRRLGNEGQVDARPFLERATETTVMTLSQLMVPVGVRDSLSGLRGFRSRAAKKIAQRSRVASAAFGVEWLALAQWLGFQVVECPIRWVRGPQLAARGRASHTRLSLLGDVWRTRQRLGGSDYESGMHPNVLLHETSFVRLDRDALIGSNDALGGR